jgi:DNA topoisomerase-1
MSEKRWITEYAEWRGKRGRKDSLSACSVCSVFSVIQTRVAWFCPKCEIVLSCIPAKWIQETGLLKQLIHNGVLVPEAPAYRGLKLRIRGAWVTLNPKQEEMALAWAKKQGTPYVEDRVFVANFMGDFSRALGLAAPLRASEVDFSPALEIVQEEKAVRERLTPEERKAGAAERKARREELREQYGFATWDGERVEIANYIVEPSGIFMGRGEHPLRGRWKEGAQQQDITLNLSPDAPRPAGNWGEIVWQPESLWLAKWEDKLSIKLKYVWLNDTASVKQSREAHKFDAATRLDEGLDKMRAHILAALADPKPKRRAVATACALIDALCLRVGDEKDPDEADTVGATTLRPEHVTLREDGQVEFRFLGKDSVLWHKTLELPPQVRQNLEELIRDARPSSSSRDGRGHPTRDKPQLFPDISSRDVNAFLSEAIKGVSAKVFRTHHATAAVSATLEEARVEADDPEYLKWQAASLANLEAAELCNHTKKDPPSWPERRERMQERIGKAEEHLAKCREEVKAARGARDVLREEARAALAEIEDDKARAKKKAANDKKIARAESQLQTLRQREGRAKEALGKLKTQFQIAGKGRAWNLVTSLKSYIDPRVYHRWGQQVEYDVLEKYYPTTLRRKYAWVKRDDSEEEG